MIRYKLHKDARQFFLKFFDKTEPIDWWTKQGVPIEVLVEAPKVHVLYGHKIDNTTILKKWRNKKTQMNFTVVVDDTELKEHDNIRISDVMDHIQNVLDKYFKP